MISIGFQAPKIVASVMNCKDQSDFASQTSILKNQKFTWNPNTKYWEKSALLYNDNLEDILRCVAKDVYFPTPIKQLIKEFPSKLPSELIQDQEILNIDYSKLCKINPKTDSHFCPVKGKAPYENYQDEDIRRALRQNRFLFNWTMGALAGDEHLYIKLNGEVFDTTIKDFFNFCKTGTKVNFRPCQIFFNSERLDLEGDKHNQGPKSKNPKVPGVYKVTYIPQKLTYVGSSSDLARRIREHKCSIRLTGGLQAGPVFGDTDLANYKFEFEKTSEFLFKEKELITSIPNINKKGTNQQYFKVKTIKHKVHERPNLSRDFYKPQDVIHLEDKNIQVLDRNKTWTKVNLVFKNDKRNTPQMLHIFYKEYNKTYCISCTEDHPLWTGKAFTRADQLKVGDKLYRADNLELTVVDISWSKKHCESYDINTATGTFIGSDIVMHNCGKSFATAIIYEYLNVYKNVDKMILLTTRIGTYNLQSELSKFCLHVDRDDVLVFNSPKSYKKYSRRIFDNEEVCNKKVLVFSYDSWKLMATAYGDKARGRTLNIPLDNFYGVGKDKLICLDECQQLSNPKSDRSRSLFKYMKYFKYRYLFSATPADKNEKLYSVCMLLDPKLVRYMKYNEWINYYNDVGTWFSKYAINPKKWHQEDLDALNQDLARYSAKRDAKDVLELPPARTETFTIDMSDKQKELYRLLTNDIVNNAIKKNPSLDGASVDVIHEAFSTVCSFCENPNILGTNTSQLVSDHIKEKCAKYNYSSDYAKLDVIDAILEDEIDEQEAPNRGILWYTHPKTKDVVVERYAKYKPIIIAAELSEEERDAALAEFKSNPEHKILIASQNILATSVTLIECTFAIYLETSFSYETYLQSTGRIYRIGQDKHVRFYHVWLNGSTDMFHVNAIETKRSLVDTLFSAKEKPVLSLAQMRDLFSGKAV